MRYIALFILVSLLGCSSPPKTISPSASLYFQVEPVKFEDKASLLFTLSFNGDASGKTFLVLPEKWASEADYFKDIRDLKVLNLNATVKDGDKPYIKIIEHQPNERLSISYIVIQAKRQGDNPYRALIENDYFHFIGHNAFAHPPWNTDMPFEIEIHWKNFPGKYVFANSYDSRVTRQKFATTLNNLKHALFTGGDFRVKKFTIRGKPLFVSLRGEWPFSDNDFYNTVGQMIKSQRTFWQDFDFPYLLVSLIPNGAPCCSLGGTALTNTFAIFVPNDQKLDKKLEWNIAHELFHLWNGWKIPMGQPEPLSYWFSEGVTNYYARLLTLRAGFMTLEEYVKDYNEVLYSYNFSPVRSAPNQRIQQDFWKNSDVRDLPYIRGDILAHNWNFRIKTQSQGQKSFDDFMKTLLKEAQTNKLTVTNESIVPLLSPMAANIQTDIDKHIVKGQLMTAEPGALGPCVRQERIEKGAFELGYDPKSYETGVLTGVKPGSAAHKAGLRNGQKILDRKIVFPPLEPSRIKIQDKEVTKWIRFVPVNNTKVRISQYVLDKERFEKTPNECMAWFL